MTTKFAELERASWQRERELLQQQVHLARAAATGTGRREGKVGCFWDYGTFVERIRGKGEVRVDES